MPSPKVIIARNIAGVLAAPALIALEEGPRLVGADHRRAARLAARLAAFDVLQVRSPESNIVMVDLRGCAASELVEHLAACGVRALAVGPSRLRFVTHRDVGDDDVERCAEAVGAWVHATARGNTGQEQQA